MARSFSKNQSSGRPWHSFNSVLALLPMKELRPRAGEEVCPPHTGRRDISSWSTWPLPLAFLPRLRSSCGKAVFVGRSGATDWQKEEKWWFQFRWHYRLTGTLTPKEDFYSQVKEVTKVVEGIGWRPSEEGRVHGLDLAERTENQERREKGPKSPLHPLRTESGHSTPFASPWSRCIDSVLETAGAQGSPGQCVAGAWAVGLCLSLPSHGLGWPPLCLSFPQRRDNRVFFTKRVHLEC